MKTITRLMSAANDKLAGPYLLGTVLIVLGLFVIIPELVLLGAAFMAGSIVAALWLAYNDAV